METLHGFILSLVTKPITVVMNPTVVLTDGCSDTFTVYNTIDKSSRRITITNNTPRITSEHSGRLDQVEINTEKCSVCLSDIVSNISLKCKHAFCIKCIATWFSLGKKTCPMCRAQINSV